MILNLLLLFFNLNISSANEKTNHLKLENPDFTKEVDALISGFTSKLISVNELSEIKNDFILLDVREKNEFEVSHLAGAIHVGYENINLEEIEKKYTRSQKIIVYCSVGYRSGKIADKLQKKGFNVYNLYGGIFEWANQKKMLVDNSGKETHKIHTYNKKWSKWVTGLTDKVYGSLK